MKIKFETQKKIFGIDFHILKLFKKKVFGDEIPQLIFEYQ